MKLVPFGQIDRVNRSAGVFRGFNMVATLLNAALNTAFAAGSPINWELIMVNLNIKRASGKVHQIYQGPAAPAILATCFYQGQYQQVVNLGTVYQNIYILQSAGVAAVMKQSAQINFPIPISVNSGDQLMGEVNFTSGATIAAVAQTASTIISFDFIDAVGNPYALPQIGQEVVRAGETSFPINGGDGIKACYFINTDKSGISLANEVLSTVSWYSDKVSRNMQWEELLESRYEAFYNPTDADARHNSFELVNVNREKQVGGDPWLDGFGGTLTLFGANVSSSKNWVVYVRCIPDSVQLSIARNRKNKHSQENAQQLIG